MQNTAADNFKRYEEQLDATLAANIANGWTPNTWRIIETRGGYAIEEFVSSVQGQPYWLEDYFTTNKDVAEKALARRAK